MNTSLDRNIGVRDGSSTRRGLVALVLVVAPLAAVQPALAAGGGDGHHASFVDIIPYWVNFLIYVSLIYLVFRGSAVEAWRRRRANIKKSISAIEEEMASLDAKIAEARAKLTGIGKDVERISTEIGREADSESSLVIADAERAAKRVREQGQDLIKAERRNVEVSVQQELVENVMRLATERLKAESNPETDRSRRDASIGHIGQLVQ